MMYGFVVQFESIYNGNAMLILARDKEMAIVSSLCTCIPEIGASIQLLDTEGSIPIYL